MTGVHNFWGRILIVVGLCVVGLVFPWLFLAAAFIASTLYGDIKEARSGTKPVEPPPTQTFYERESDLTWQERSVFRTESVAEEAFLNAMIDAFDLKPAGDDLAGNGLRFAFQRQILRYRVDFILDDWLIVEIDGAQWHSSPEAVERDRLRDADLRELDYSILRIPAKTVLRTPQHAIRQVKEALTQPTAPITDHERDRRKVAGKAKAGIAKRISNAVNVFEKIAADADRRSKIKSALQKPTHAFEYEKFMIEQAIRDAEMEVTPEKHLGSDSEYRKLYKQNLEELREMLGEPEPEAVPVSLLGFRFSAPPQTGDAEIDTAVRERFMELSKERKRYFDDVISRLGDKDVRLEALRRLEKKAGMQLTMELSERSGENIFDILIPSSAARGDQKQKN